MDLAFKIEEMEKEAEIVNSLLLAVYEAIYNGCVDYRKFEWALHEVSGMAQDHMEHMKSLTDETFALLQKKNA